MTNDSFFNFTGFNDTGFDFNETSYINDTVYATTLSTANPFSGRFSSCSQVEAALGTDNYWCWSVDDHYDQVFGIAFLLLLTYIGQSLLMYGTSSAIFNALAGVSFSELKNKEALMSALETANVFTENNFISGLHITVYFVLQAILAGLFFAVKMILYYDDDKQNEYHYLEHLVNEWNDDGFKDFVNAKNILLALIIGHSMSTVRTNYKLFRGSKASTSKLVFALHTLCTLIMLADGLCGLIILCIKWPLILVAFYLSAVGMFVGCILACTFCITVPLVTCYTYVVLFLFRALVCFQEGYITNYLKSLGGGIIALSVYYLVLCLVFVFTFLFIGGPNEGLIWVDTREDSSDMKIIGLFAVSCIIGLIALLIGLVTSCLRQCSGDDDTATSKRQPDHKRVATSDDKEIEAVDVGVGSDV